MKIYLAHPSFSQEAGRQLESFLTNFGFTVINPFSYEARETIYDKVRDGIPFDEDDCLHIVFGDLYKILSCDVVVALFDSFSVGVPMEIAISVFWLKKPVFLLWRINHTNRFWCPRTFNADTPSQEVHPWLRVLTNVCFSEEELAQKLLHFSNGENGNLTESDNSFRPKLINGLTVIGVCGRSRSGKSSFASYIRDSYGYSHYNLATPLYEISSSLLSEKDKLNLNDAAAAFHETYKDLTPIFGGSHTLRTLLQGLGIGVHDGFGKNALVDAAFFYVVKELAMNPANTKFVIENLRLPVQVEFVKKLGGKNVWINRNGANLPKYVHPTESSITPDMCDFVISASNLKELYEEADKIVKAVQEESPAYPT